MTNSEIICGAESVSRYIDNELDEDELVSFKSHIVGCETCRIRLRDYNKIGEEINSFIQAQPAAYPIELENNVARAIRRKNKARVTGWKDIILSKRVFMPVGLAVSVMMMFLTFFNDATPIGPTAIVSSLSGSGTSVVVLETTETRQTIIWVGENG